jgi:hypothetical protein
MKKYLVSAVVALPFVIVIILARGGHYGSPAFGVDFNIVRWF